MCSSASFTLLAPGAGFEYRLHLGQLLQGATRPAIWRQQGHLDCTDRE